MSAFRWKPLTQAYATIDPLPNGGAHTVGNPINDVDRLTGTASTNGRWHAIFGARRYGTLDIGGIPGQVYTAGTGINDHDEIVGIGGGDVSAGFYWTRATGMIILQTLGGVKAGAFSINASSSITGQSATSDGPTHAVLWPDKNSAPQDLGTLPGGTNSYGRHLNSSGTVVGVTDVP